MKKFLNKVILFGLPIILILVTMEYLLRNIPNDYSYKNAYLEKNAGNIETLFLGSSHAYYGINPEYYFENSFNASHVSQTIDLDYELLHKFGEDFTNLKYLVIPIDYFSLFARTSTGLQPWRMKNYNIYYHLNTSLEPKYYSEFFTFTVKKNLARIKGYYVHDVSGITCSSLGYGNVDDSESGDLIETGKIAAERHRAKNKIYLKQSIELIEKIIAYAKDKNITVLFYTSPGYYSYRENLDSYQLNKTINTMDSISKAHENVFYNNYLADSSFVSEDYDNADHLNSKGAKKLTLKIKNFFENLE